MPAFLGFPRNFLNNLRSDPGCVVFECCVATGSRLFLPGCRIANGLLRQLENRGVKKKNSPIEIGELLFKADTIICAFSLNRENLVTTPDNSQHGL